MRNSDVGNVAPSEALDVLQWYWEREITKADTPKTFTVDLGGRASALLLSQISVKFDPETDSGLIRRMLGCTLVLSVKPSLVGQTRPQLAAPLSFFPGEGFLPSWIFPIRLSDGAELSVELTGEVLVPVRVRLGGLLERKKADV